MPSETCEQCGSSIHDCSACTFEPPELRNWIQFLIREALDGRVACIYHVDTPWGAFTNEDLAYDLWQAIPAVPHLRNAALHPSSATLYREAQALGYIPRISLPASWCGRMNCPVCYLRGWQRPPSDCNDCCRDEGRSCWTCNHCTTTARAALEVWNRYYVSEVLAGGANHPSHVDRSCPCHAFTRSSEAHARWSELCVATGYRTIGSRQSMAASALQPPVDILRAEAMRQGWTPRDDDTDTEAPRHPLDATIHPASRTCRPGCPVCYLRGRDNHAIDLPHRTLIAPFVSYGVEIECLLPGNAVYNGPFQPGDYHAGEPVGAYPYDWTAERDGSLSTNREGYRGIEVVSPRLHGAGGLDSIDAMCDLLDNYDARVNASCGLHVHVGTGQADEHQVRHVTILFAALELAFFASCGQQAARRWNNEYCTHAVTWLPEPRSGRYQTLNLKNVQPDSARAHYEVRIWPGTVQSDYISMAVHMAVGVVVAGTAGWLPDPDANLDTPEAAVKVLDAMLEKQTHLHVADKLRADRAREALARRARLCNVSAPAVRTYVVDKAALLLRGGR